MHKLTKDVDVQGFHCPRQPGNRLIRVSPPGRRLLLCLEHVALNSLPSVYHCCQIDQLNGIPCLQLHLLQLSVSPRQDRERRKRTSKANSQEVARSFRTASVVGQMEQASTHTQAFPKETDHRLWRFLGRCKERCER